MNEDELQEVTDRAIEDFDEVALDPEITRAQSLSVMEEMAEHCRTWILDLRGG